MAAKDLSFKLRIHPNTTFKRFSIAESLETITLEHIWTEIRSAGSSSSVPVSSQSHGIYVTISKHEPAQLERATSDQHFRGLIERIGSDDKIRLECKENSDESFVMVDSTCATPKELPNSSGTPSTAPKAALGHSQDGQLYPEPRNLEAFASPSVCDSVCVKRSEEEDVINLSELAEAFQLYSFSVEECKGKKAIVLFGRTGSGKTSTSLHFLSALLVTREFSGSIQLVDGSFMDVNEDVLAIDDSDSSRFEGFKIGHGSMSETKVITTKCLDTSAFPSEAQSPQLQDLYVADLPGFDDSKGPQSDIVQCVTSLNAIKGMHSMWPVFVITCDDIDERGSVQSKFKPLVRLIARIFSPIDDYIPSEEEMKSGKEGKLHFLFTKSDGRDVKWVVTKLNYLCDPKHTDDLGGPDVTKLVKYMFYYVKMHMDKKRPGLLLIKKQDLVSSGASSHPCVTIKRIVDTAPIRDTPSLMCGLSEMTLSKLVAKVGEQASVIKSLFTQDPPQYSAACKTLQLLCVTSSAVCDQKVRDIFENALQFVCQQIHSLLESSQMPLQSRDFDRLHAVMMTMKNCLEALRPHTVLRELYQEVEAKKKELCRIVTQIANEARTVFFPADGEWTPCDTKEEKDRLQTLQAIERAFFAKGVHQFINQTADQRYPYIKKHLQAVILKFETSASDILKSLCEFADAEMRYHSANIEAIEHPCSLERPAPLDAVETAKIIFKSLMISKRTMENYEGHLTSSFSMLRDDFSCFLSETFRELLLSSYCRSIRSFQLYTFTSRLVTCLDFLKELESNLVLQMIGKPQVYGLAVTRIQQMCSGLFTDIDANFQIKQYGLVQRDLQFLRSFETSEHTKQFLPHEIRQKIHLIEVAMKKLCSDVNQCVEQFKDRETLELRDCQKMVDLIKELHSAQCLQSFASNIAADVHATEESGWSVASTLDTSLDVLTSECKTRCLSFRHCFIRHDDHTVVFSQLIRLCRMAPLQDLGTIQNSAKATPSIVTEFREQMKEVIEKTVFEIADGHKLLNWQSLDTETAQLESKLVSIKWLAEFFESPQDRFSDMSAFGRHDCFINFVSMCQERCENLKLKLVEFQSFFKEQIEERRKIALDLIQTKDPARDMPLLKQHLDFMREMMNVEKINAFMDNVPSKRYLGVIEKLKDKIVSLVSETEKAFEKTNYECVTPNREYFDKVYVHICDHMPESVNITDINMRFSKQHSASTLQMRENLPQYLHEQKFREIAVCLMNLQRTKDSEPNDKTLFDQFNDDISSHLHRLSHEAEDLEDDDPLEAILKLRDVLEKSWRTLCLHTVKLSGRNVVDVFRDILKCCWDKFEALEKRKCKCFDPVLRPLNSEFELSKMIFTDETPAKSFAAQIQEFKTRSIETLHEKIVKEFKCEGIDQGSSGYAKVAAMFHGVSAADATDSNHGVLFDGILDFEELSKELSNSVIIACQERLTKVASCTGQSNFQEAQEQLDCVNQFLAAIRDQNTARNPKLLSTEQELKKQESALARARQNNVLKRFRFTSNEVPKCIELLNEQLVSDYITFEASWKALEQTLKHEVGELTALTSKPFSNLEEKDVQRVFEVSSGIIRFGSEGQALLDQHCTSHPFRGMVGEAPPNLSAFVKKLILGYESQLKNFVKLSDLCTTVQKLKVGLQDPGLQSWSEAKVFIEKCSKISQKSEKAIESVREAISTVKDFDIKRYDKAAAKKLTDNLCYLRKQEKPDGDFDDSDPSSEDSETGKYQAVLAQLSAQIQATGKLQIKIESDYKIDRESFQQLFAAMTNCQQFESDSALRDIASQERSKAEKKFIQVVNGFVSTFGKLVQEQTFQDIDQLVSTGLEIDSIFFDSFKNCFPSNKALVQHCGEAFKSLLDERHKSFSRRRDVKEYAQGMIDIRQISTAVSNVSLPDVRSEGDNMLKAIITKLPGNIQLFELGCELQAMDAAGQEIVEDVVNFPQFKAVKNAQFNKQTEGVGIHHALTEMKQPKPNDSLTGRVPTPEAECERMSHLLKRYHETEESLLKRFLKGYADFAVSPEAALVRQLHNDARALGQSWQPMPIIDILAGIGAVWTITASGKEFNDSGRKKETLLRLHNVQVIGLIRLLKLSEEEKLFARVGRVVTFGTLSQKIMSNGHMIQVGTGEGKSVLLGVLSCFLALTGIQVRCACYSQLLSRRDYSDFEGLFKKFNVDSLIRYSTIDELAEECINEKGDVRSLTLRHVGCLSSSVRRSHERAPSTPKVLLIDEVDVFFSNTFMGQSFNPTALLGCENTTALMKHIWHSRPQPPHTVLAAMKQLPEYTALKKNTFSAAAADIVDRELLNMITDAKAFNDPPYEVFNAAEKGTEARMSVGYKRLDGITTKVHYGYKTAFAWLCEAEKTTVSSEAAEKRLQFQIPCGRFSYASIPKKHFQCVLGVTGTLSCLTANERKLIHDDYQIGPEHMTYLPSLYGPSNMKFNGKDHLIVDANEERWQQTILKRINDEAITRGRPILVFFESEERIKQFLESEYGRRMPTHQLIVESTLDVPFRVSKATAPSQVTLLSRIFGRGLDFKVNHPSIESVDGVCVICTFFPDSASEEIQIKGRSARQGKKGTFEFILCQTDVQRDFSATPEQLKDSPYEFLVKQRTAKTDQLLDAKKEQVARCEPDHVKSMDFVQKLQQIHPQADSIFQSIRGFLRSQGSAGPIHTIFCLDDSGSMSASWPSVKEAVRAFIEIRQDLGCPDDLFSCIQFSSNTTVSFQNTRIETALKHSSRLTLRGGGTLFSPALEAVSGIIQANQQVAIVFMTDGASSDNPIAVAQHIMSKGAQISFFGVAFTPAGKTQILQDMVQAFNGILVEAANVKELRAQFQVIAKDPTAAHAR